MIINKFSVSVVITCYSEGEKILDAIHSINHQTYLEFEIILVNDASPDPDTNRICALLADTDIKVMRTPQNVGPSGARNFGIAAAKGDIIIPLDADDVLPKNAVELILNAFESDVNVGFVYGDYMQVNLTNKTSSIVDCSVITNSNLEICPDKVLYNWILLGMSPFKKQLWEAVGGYSMEFSFTCQDVDLQMKSILNGYTSRYIKDVIYIWNKSETGINSSDANVKSISKCYFNNFEYLLKYSFNDDALLIALKYNDGIKIKMASKRMLELKRKKLISAIFYYSPSLIIPVIAFVYDGIKKVRRTIIK